MTRVHTHSLAVMPQTSSSRAPSGVIRRKCACGGKASPIGVCAECSGTHEGALQRRLVHSTTVGTVPPAVQDVLRSPGQPLDLATRAFMEPRFGHDFSQVRVHANHKAAESAHAINALAYTVGQDIVFGTGQYAPKTAAGQRVLAHELAHVVQQANPESTASVAHFEVEGASGITERESDMVAAQVLNGHYVQNLHAVKPAVQRLKAPYITRVTVNLTPPESVSLEWRGTPPAEPGSDSFTCSTGKGYDPDTPGACTRNCCSGAETQCAPPYNRPDQVGSCCTPVGSNFWTGKPRPEHNGWLYWTPVEPIHTAGGRGIALHQHNEVTGGAIGHGCIRMTEDNAHRIYLYSRGKATNVTITGRATVDCPARHQCGVTGAREGTEGATRTAIAELREPDAENPGGGGSAVEPPIAGEQDELV